jgi:hypothetical protein
MVGLGGRRRTIRTFIDGRNHIAAGRRRGCIHNARAVALPPQSIPKQERAQSGHQ